MGGAREQHFLLSDNVDLTQDSGCYRASVMFCVNE